MKTILSGDAESNTPSVVNSNHRPERLLVQEGAVVGIRVPVPLPTNWINWGKPGSFHICLYISVEQLFLLANIHSISLKK